MTNNTDISTYFIVYPDGAKVFGCLNEAQIWAEENIFSYEHETFYICKGEIIGEVYLPEPEPQIEWVQR